MKLAVIAPPEYLNEVHTARLSYHMALGQELLRNVAYCDWYRWRHNRGDFIIVDNGAAEPGEERIPFEAVLNAAEYVHADEVILPDVLYDWAQTVALTTHSAVLDQVPAKNRMIVPQGTDFDEWVKCFKAIINKTEVRSVGIAKHMEKTAALKGGRAGIIKWLVYEGYTEWFDFHLLGVWDQPVLEVQRASRAYSAIRGIDTAAPIAYAQRGFDIRVDTHCSLDWTDTDASRDLVRSNIKDLMAACAIGENRHASQSV